MRTDGATCRRDGGSHASDCTTRRGRELAFHGSFSRFLRIPLKHPSRASGRRIPQRIRTRGDRMRRSNSVSLRTRSPNSPRLFPSKLLEFLWITLRKSEVISRLTDEERFTTEAKGRTGVRGGNGVALAQSRAGTRLKLSPGLLGLHSCGGFSTFAFVHFKGKGNKCISDH